MKKKIILIAALAVVSSVLAPFIALQDASACSAGDKAQVEWKGSWYPATVLKVNGDQCFIHYKGYGSNWDEWVGPGRIKLAGASAPAAAPAAAHSDGDSVQVLWKGTWYPAHVIGVKGSQLKIHYDGYDNSWDEWVGPNRYR